MSAEPIRIDYEAEARLNLARAEKAETERNEWEARAVRAEEELRDAHTVIGLAVPIMSVKQIAEWQEAIRKSRAEAPRGSSGPDASTTDHERTPQVGSSSSSKSDTEDR